VTWLILVGIFQWLPLQARIFQWLLLQASIFKQLLLLASIFQWLLLQASIFKQLLLLASIFQWLLLQASIFNHRTVYSWAGTVYMLALYQFSSSAAGCDIHSVRYVFTKQYNLITHSQLHRIFCQRNHWTDCARSNLIYLLAKSLGTVRSDNSDFLLPAKRMPMGLIEYCVNFFNTRGMIEHKYVLSYFYLHCRFIAHQTIDHGLRQCMCFLALNGVRYLQALIGAMRQLSKSIQLQFVLTVMNQIRFVILVIFCL